VLLSPANADVCSRMLTYAEEEVWCRCKVLVSPAVSGLASFKTKNLEALARGMPVVTTRLAALGLHQASANVC
jgi:hypothetical protein